MGVFALLLCVQLSLPLSFGACDEAGVIPLSRQTGTSSTSCFVSAELAAAFGGSSFSQPSRLPCSLRSCSPCQGLEGADAFLRLRGREWESGAAGLSISLCGAVLLSSGELPLRRWSWKLRLHALFFQISSFLSHCLTFCLCLCYRNRAKGLSAQVFCSLWLLNNNRVRFEACTGISSVPASFGDPFQVRIVCLPSCSDCLP